MKGGGCIDSIAYSACISFFPARIAAAGATWLRSRYQVNILAISSADAKREATSSAVCSLGRP